MADAVIRPQTEADVDAVLDVLESVAGEGRWIATELPLDRAGRGAQFRARLAAPEAFAGFVAEVDGRIVGSIGLELEPYGVVHLGMSLVDGYRGLGLGTRMLEAGIEWARRIGAHKLALQVWPHNEAALGLYRKLGFVEEGLLRRHYPRKNGELWDAVVMGLLLESA